MRSERFTDSVLSGTICESHKWLEFFLRRAISRLEAEIRGLVRIFFFKVELTGSRCCVLRFLFIRLIRIIMEVSRRYLPSGLSRSEFIMLLMLQSQSAFVVAYSINKILTLGKRDVLPSLAKPLVTPVSRFVAHLLHFRFVEAG